jgi:putative addiction module component (TIGR02574 family)
MSKTEILQELPKLALEERREILELICELEETDLLNGGELSTQEKVLLDRELDDYQQTPAAGSPWHEVEARIRKRPVARSIR